jgi:hypothetical protein
MELGMSSKPLVVFTPSGKRGYFEKGTSILQIARQLGEVYVVNAKLPLLMVNLQSMALPLPQMPCLTGIKSSSGTMKNVV